MAKDSHGNLKSHGDRSVRELIVASDQLQERSREIQDHASRTSGLIVSTNERSQRLIGRIQYGNQLADLGLHALRGCLERQAECLSVAERALDSYRQSSEVSEREYSKDVILRKIREVEALSTALTKLANQAAADIARELKPTE